jgi:triphosphatase
LELARRVADMTPVKVGVLSKAERGFALADGRFGKVTKAEPVALNPGMSVAEAFATIIASCIRHFRLNEPVVASRRMPEALHQARVALRRLRSAFSLFKSAASDDEFDQLNDELRWFTRQLGDARNLDVYLQRDPPKDERPRLEREREAAYDWVIEAMDSDRCRSLILDIVAWSAIGKWRTHAVARRPVTPYVDRRIDRLWSRIGQARRLPHMSEHERHRLRIVAKKLRYALEFTASLHSDDPDEQRKFARGIEDLQESLGQLNDVAVARTMSAANTWLIELHQRDAAERALIDDAGHSLDRLRDIGRYWRDAEN